MALAPRAEFDADQFTDTRFDTAADKALGLERLARFVESGFAANRWSKATYTVLSQHLFGHIAHYDSYGFYDEWFSSDHNQRAWVDHALGAASFGSPNHTWSDAQTVFQGWLARIHAVA